MSKFELLRQAHYSLVLDAAYDFLLLIKRNESDVNWQMSIYKVKCKCKWPNSSYYKLCFEATDNLKKEILIDPTYIFSENIFIERASISFTLVF